MSLEHARALARHAFAGLWRGGEMTVERACAWLRQRFAVEVVDQIASVSDCERLVAEIVAFWAERNATRCPCCGVPVRSDHAHALFDNRLFHLNCIPRAVA
jgi:hypothetical protein